MANQTEREALVQTIASSLAMSYGSHVNAPKGGRDWKAAENLLGVLEHLGLRRIDPDDEALDAKCDEALSEWREVNERAGLHLSFDNEQGFETGWGAALKAIAEGGA